MLNQFLCVYHNVLSDGASLFSVFFTFLQLFLQRFGADGETTRTFSTHHKKKKGAEKMHPQANKGAHTSARQSPPLQNQAAAKTPSIISLQITVTHLDGLALVQWWWVEGGDYIGKWGPGVFQGFGSSGTACGRHRALHWQRVLSSEHLSRVEKEGGKKKKIHGGAKDQWGTRGH